MKESDVIGISAGSVAFCMILGLMLLAGAVFSKVHSAALVNVLLGGDASFSLIQASQEDLTARVDLALGNDTLGRTVVFLCWMFVGLTVYALLEGIVKATKQVRDVKVRMHLIHQDEANFSKTLVREWTFRTAVSLVWVVFSLITLNMLLPVFFAAVAILFGESVQPIDWVVALVAQVGLFFILHIHVILARLFFGRIRLFTT